MKNIEPMALLPTVVNRCELPFGSPVSPDALSSFISIADVNISDIQEADRK